MDIFGKIYIKHVGVGKKRCRFVVHNNHLYVTNGNFCGENGYKVERLTSDEYNDKLIELHEKTDFVNQEERSFIILKTKYLLNEPDSLQIINIFNQWCLSTYTNINIDFYNKSGIRALYYCEKYDSDDYTTLDIDNAYGNLMTSKRFPYNDGNEFIMNYEDYKKRYKEELCCHYFYELDKSGYILGKWVTGDTLLRFPELLKKRKIINVLICYSQRAGINIDEKITDEIKKNILIKKVVNFQEIIYIE